MTKCSGLANTEGISDVTIRKNPCAGQGTGTNLVIHRGFIKPPELGGSGGVHTVGCVEGEFWPFEQYSVRWVARAVYQVSHPLVISISKCVWISLYFNLQLRVKFQDYFPSVWTFLFRRLILVQVYWWKTLSFSISVITSSSFFDGIFTEYRISFDISFSFIILNMSFHFCFHYFYQEVSSFISSFVGNTPVFLQLVLNVSLFLCFPPVCLSCTLLPFSLHTFFSKIFRDTWICEIVSFINVEKKNSVTLSLTPSFYRLNNNPSGPLNEWMNVLVTQSCPTLCNPMDCSPPGSSVHRILQANILEWVAISYSQGMDLPDSGTEPGSPALRADSLPSKPILLSL